ncbi:DNA-binding transcriptional regulator [Micromonospora sp. KC721]|uniref:helix-turn-helix domain-containing protein n=1 Tax=Micromonospora sp. KC721 TaxID=2530380 RepID=UPI001A9E089C|nr:helix-turn-helix domain-containing protein [Micromonospora sp. KC721]
MSAIRRWSGREIRALRQALRMSVRAFAPYLGVSERAVSKWEAGQAVPGPDMQAALDIALSRAEPDVVSRFDLLVCGKPDESGPTRVPAISTATTVIAGAGPAGGDDELDALELARRVAASDVSDETLNRLERVVDELAMAYAQTPPQQLIVRVRQHLLYVGQLVDGRKTLRQHRRLLVIGGWLSLLAATLHVDFRQPIASRARLDTAARLAIDTDHDEMTAWCVETRAWDLLTDGHFRDAASLAREAQDLAPHGSSAHLQATAQEGRAWARMGEAGEVRRSLNRLSQLIAPLPKPDGPEHHYRYDPNKALAYTATTLSWIGDPAAEGIARDAITELERASDGVRRPRRIASAQLDLSLALLKLGKPDEAGATALLAICSGRIVPSNRWRAAEVVAAVEASGVVEAADLREAYQTYCS